jgi:hypothetical protein
MVKLHEIIGFLSDMFDHMEKNEIDAVMKGGLAVQAYALNNLQERNKEFTKTRPLGCVSNVFRETEDVDLDFNAEPEHVHETLFEFAEDAGIIYEPSHEKKRFQCQEVHYGTYHPKQGNNYLKKDLKIDFIPRNKSLGKKVVQITRGKKTHVLPLSPLQGIIQDKTTRREDRDISDLELLRNLGLWNPQD